MAVSSCGYQISPTANTVFHKSPTPLTVWFYVIYLMSQTRGGISAKQIQRETGVTYKCAWRMCKQVRSMLFEDYGKMGGDVEMDKSYFGGRKFCTATNADAVPITRRLYSEWLSAAASWKPARLRTSSAVRFIQSLTRTLQKSAQIYTDEFRMYDALPVMGYKHASVPHAEKIYVIDDAHTNTIEGFWSQAKNGIRGVYHAVSADYLQHYLDEYAFRYNHRDDVKPMFFSFLSRVKPSANAG